MQKDQKGESQVSTFVWLAVFAAVIYAGWNVAPVYASYYSMKDKVVLIARAPRGTNTNDKIWDMINKEAGELGLDDYIKKNDCQIQTTENYRKIHCAYERSAKILPGYTRTFSFTIDADEPLVF